MKLNMKTLLRRTEGIVRTLPVGKVSLALIAGALLCFWAGYSIRSVEQERVTLLCGQSYDLPQGGSVSVTGESAQLSDHTLTGVSQGTTSVRMDFLTEVREYEVQVYPASPQGPAEQEVYVDSQCQLSENPEDYPVEWSSSDKSVVTVKDGLVTGVKPGTAQVTETLNDYVTYTYTVTVPEPVLETRSYTIYNGESIQLKVSNHEEDIQWSVDGEAVQVDEKSEVTALKPGKAKLTAVVGGQELKAQITVEEAPEVDTQVTLETDQTYQLKVTNSLGKVKFSSADEKIATVDQSGLITPVAPGVTSIAVEVREKKMWTQVTVKYTPEELFRISNYGDYQPEEASIAALAMLGMCDYYNDVMMADKANWYDTNLTSFSPKDTFEQEYNASRKGANCNSLLNWSWDDMDIKSGHGTKLYGDKQGELHGYNSSNRALRGLVNSCCEFSQMHGATLNSLVKKGNAKPGDMFFMTFHTYIYRGDGTVFASAGDAKCRRKGKDLIFLNWINGHSSYDWKRKTHYRLRFKEDYIPRLYRNKAGDVVENPMYTVKNGGSISDEDYAVAVAASTVKKEEVLKNIKNRTGTEEETGEKENREGLLDAALATQNALAAEGGVEGAGDTDVEPNTAAGKPYGSRPAMPRRSSKIDRTALGHAGGKPYGTAPAGADSKAEKKNDSAQKGKSDTKRKKQEKAGADAS